MLGKYLVRSVISYGAEFWGWTKRNELEKIQLDYLRWILKSKFQMPKYLILKETDSRKWEIDWRKRAIKFEEKIHSFSDNRLRKQC